MTEAWHSHEEKVAGALFEANQLRGILAERADRRMQNIVGIEKKLAAGGNGEITLRPRKRARLEHALRFLRTYDTRHPTHG